MNRYEVERYAQAPTDTVFAVVADADGWSTWSHFATSHLERKSDTDAPEGVGAVRRFVDADGAVRREEVTLYRPPYQLGCAVLSGTPARRHRSEISLTPDNGGTHIRWAGTFRSRWPASGWVVRLRVLRFVRSVLDQLVTEAERRSAEVP